MKCAAHRKNGDQCRRDAIAGGNVCIVHGAAAGQVRRKAHERLLEAADPVAAKLVHLALHAESEAVQRQACSDLLDRAGLAGKQIIEVSGSRSLIDELNEGRKRLLEHDERNVQRTNGGIAGS